MSSAPRGLKGSGSSLVGLAMLGTGLSNFSVANCSTSHSCSSKLLCSSDKYLDQGVHCISKCPGGCSWLLSSAFSFDRFGISKSSYKVGFGGSKSLILDLSVWVPMGESRIGPGTC